MAAGLCPAALIVLALPLAVAAQGSAVTAVEPQWRLPDKPLPREFRHDGVVVQVTPLLVEPVTAFLIGRGFPAPMARRYAETCVIRVAMSNESAPAPISYDLRAWRMRRQDGSLSSALTREDWMKEWRASALSNTSRMGFEWSQLPTTQELHRGDSTQGMVNTGLASGSHFDLMLEWASHGNTYRHKLEGIYCAPPP